jgi:hypothetical protein
VESGPVPTDEEIAMRDPLGLDALLYGDDGYSDTTEPAVIPPDMGVAGWHNRKASVYRGQMSELSALFDEEIELLQGRLEVMLGVLERQAVWHERAVEAWHRQNVRAVGKTVTFPSGPRSELRGSAPKLVVQDEDALRVFLSGRTNENGEALERVVWVPQPERFMVSELNKVIQVPKTKKGREPNEVARLVARADGVEVPGVHAIILPDRWQRGK